MRRKLAALIKMAALKDDVKLKDHQRRAIEKAKRQGSLVVTHGTGTGKTVTGIGAIEALRSKGSANKTLVVVPSSLRSNFANEGVKRFTDRKVQIIDKGSDKIDPDADYVVVSNNIFAKDPERFKGQFDSLVVDEAHNARNESTQLYKALKDFSSSVKHRVLLTASPFNNSPADLVPLLNIVKGQTDYNQGDFNKSYLKPVKKRTGFLGLGKEVLVSEDFAPDARLREDLLNYFDYERGNEGLPETEREVVRVPMTKEQLKAYRYAWNKMPAAVRMAVKRDILPDKRDSTSFFAAIANARVASNNPAALLQKHQGPMSSAKVKWLLEEMKSKPNTGLKDLVYSNYSQHGADMVQEALDRHGIKSSKISGSMNRRKKDEQIEAFKSGKTDAFITTPTGKEGISLPNIDREYIFDPHWNPEVTEQAIGRGVRADSIADKVNIKELLAVEPDKRLLGLKLKRKPSVEEWVHSVANKKTQLRDQVLESLGR